MTVLPTNHSGNDVWIFDDANKNSLFEECKNGVKDGIWEYRDASEHGYAGNMIVSYSDNKGAIIRFSAKLEQNAYITFWKNSNSAVIMIEADGEKQTADLYSDVEGGEMLRIYPFAKSMLPVIVRGGIYCLLVAMLFTALFALEQEALEPRRSKLLGYAWKKWMIFPIWGVLYFIAVVEYKRGIPNFLEFGDQLYYWNVSLLDTNGKWNPAWLSENVIAFRGYLCQLLPTISKLIGNATGIDPVHIYFLFTSFAISWLTAYVLPMLYTELTKKSAHAELYQLYKRRAPSGNLWRFCYFGFKFFGGNFLFNSETPSLGQVLSGQCTDFDWCVFLGRTAIILYRSSGRVHHEHEYSCNPPPACD
ncbi:hypothetical protein JQM68_03960 [Oscillibacter valericigenes]|uniref:hypothetical protein n=1 Tax=Oscillibacter valericigenes TaxID=351091 RepID=UPI002A654FF2|nr:hypothetical protein [Oscillibacter valericigenes]